jgi:ADP-dependent NAD(P)H-hydrate dehydratase
MSDPGSSPSAPLPRLPPRGADSHKGDYGRALVIGGSTGMAGAVGLAGLAALRSGTGLVRLAVPDVCQPTVAAYEPSYMTAGLPSDGSGRLSAKGRGTIEKLAEDATAIACGPGLGRSEELTELVRWLYQDVPRPMVIDADALNALAVRPDLLESPGGPRVLTPHPGEFARLLGLGTRDVLADRQRLATQMAARLGVVVVVKGHRTYVTDGRQSALNETGNPGMATGGTGDVLTGIITALICQGLTAYEAARLGVHVHGLAGDLAAAELGQVSLIASDLVRYLPSAFRRLDESQDAE